MKLTIFVGTYTQGTCPGMPSVDYRPDFTPPTTHVAKGIYGISFDTETGELSNVAELLAESPNPSYLAFHPTKKFLYVANELTDFGENNNSGAITVFSIDAEHKLTQVQQVSALGSTTCHLTVDKEGRHLLLTNYMGATVVGYGILASGTLVAYFAEKCDGSGPHPTRQTSAHPHSVNFSPINDNIAVVTDLGSDSLRVYELDSGNLKQISEIKSHAGSGPRQLVWHPTKQYAYVINELDSTVNVYAFEQDGKFVQKASTSISPPDYTGKKWSAEIQVHPLGKFLYGTNRIADSLAICKIDDEGLLTVVGHQPTGGLTPRNFVISPDGDFLLVANQHSDNIVSFKIDTETGALQKVAEINAPSPVCLKFL